MKFARVRAELAPAIIGGILMLFTPAMGAEYQVDYVTVTLRQDRIADLDLHVNHILHGRVLYEEAEKLTAVPWFIVGIIHGLECGYNFNCHLANGDPLGKPTTHIPRGLVAKTWVESAVQAFKQTGLLNFSPWDLQHTLYNLEMKYNGPGYRYVHPPIPSPYLWSYTSLYNRGKFVRDRVYSATAISAQAGAAAILKRLQERGVITVENNIITPVSAPPAPVTEAAVILDKATMDHPVHEPLIPAPSPVLPMVNANQELFNDGIKFVGAFIVFAVSHGYISGFIGDMATWILGMVSGVGIGGIGIIRSQSNIKKANG